jgi:hypothetical protein
VREEFRPLRNELVSLQTSRALEISEIDVTPTMPIPVSEVAEIAIHY